MSNRENNKIGILGGMGPQASCELVRLIIRKATIGFGAANGDDFPEIILDSMPVTDFISDAKSVIPTRKMLVNRARMLKSVGCSQIVMACNSAHVFFEAELKRDFPENFVSLIDLMRQEVKKRGMKTVCVFATPTTIRHDLYKKAFVPSGISVVYPEKKMMENHEQLIRHVIANGNLDADRRLMKKHAAKILKDRLAEGVVLGCTELPVVMGDENLPEIVSSLDVLSEAVVRKFYMGDAA